MNEMMLPESLKLELHPLCNKEILAAILKEVRSNPAVCIREAARAVGCSDITAQKHLSRLVRAGLAIEKRVGRTRIFIKSGALEEEEDI